MSRRADDLPQWASVFGDQDIGARTSQQDSWASAWLPPSISGDETRLLLVLADGMGGHVAGDIASELAIDCFMRTVQKHSDSDSQSLLFRGLHAAADGLFDKATTEPKLRSMGTTFVGVIVEKLRTGFAGYMVSVGDSPLWCWRRKTGTLERLNADHSLAGELALDVASGRLSATEAEDDPRRDMGHVLTSALTADGQRAYKTDTIEEPLALATGDILLLASDGLETLSPSEIVGVTATQSSKKLRPEKFAEKLLAAVRDKKAPEQDNATVLLAHLEDSRKRKVLGLF